MSADRDITDVVLAGFTSRVRRGGEPSVVARDLIGIARAHGIRFAVPAHWHDPAADHRVSPEPGDQQAGLAAALAALGKGICEACGGRVDLAEDGGIGPHEVSDDPPHPPFHPCPGGQRHDTPDDELEATDQPDATDQATHDPTDQEQASD